MPPSDSRPHPVFLIGFPRSGTTLLEQILSSHPKIFVASERDGVDKALQLFVKSFGVEHRQQVFEEARALNIPPWHLRNPCYPADLTALQTRDIHDLRQTFYQQNGADPLSAKLLVDKMPLNMLHAGFIKRLFPRARFILALRHPCDSVLSCFMQEFALNGYMQRFLDIEDAARFYDETFGLWEHLQGTFDLDVHTIRYEDVVADFQPTVAALLEFCGVDWNDAVLAYDKTALQKGRIRTPSYHQVTEKIYTRAAGRWQRYRKHLEPILPILAPWAEKYGYSMNAQTENEPADI